MANDSKGSIIRVALQIDSKKAEADAIASGKRISTNFATALNLGGNSRPPTLIQQAKAAAVQLEAQAKVAERSAKAGKEMALADLAATRAKGELTKAAQGQARAEAEVGERAARAGKETSLAAAAAARAKAELSKATLNQARAEALANKEAEKARKEQERKTFGYGFRRGFESTRINAGAASPLLSSATRSGIAGAAGAGVAVVGSFAVEQTIALAKRGVDEASDLQASLNRLSGVTEISAEGLEKVRQKAQELGGDMELPAVSANDAADAITTLKQRGLELEDSLDGAKGALQLATVAQIDFHDAAEITADALKMFNLEGSKATHVADVFANSARKGAVVTEIYDGLRQVGPVAAQANLSLEETVALLTEFANSGLRGSDAGTSLKTMLLALVAPTDEAGKLMKGLGIEVFTSSGQMRPMRDIIAQIEKALKGMSDKQRDATLKIIFGTDAIRAASIATKNGVKGFDDYTKAISKSGSAAQTASAQMKGLKGAQEGFQNALSTFLTNQANPFLHFLEDVTRKATEGVDALNNLATAAGRTKSVEDAASGKESGKGIPLATQLEDIRKARISLERTLYQNGDIRPNVLSQPGTMEQQSMRLQNLKKREAEIMQQLALEDESKRRRNSVGREAAEAKKEADAKALKDTAAKERAQKAIDDAKAGKGRKKKDDDDGEKVTAKLIDSIAKGVKTPSGQASCAFFASQVLQQIGVKIPKTGGARDLRDKAKRMGFQQVDPKEAKAGDLVVYRGKQYGKIKFNENGEIVGYHVAIARGDGTVDDSSDGKKRFGRRLNRPGVTVYRRPGGDMKAADSYQEHLEDLGKKRSDNAADALSDLTNARAKANIELNIERMGKMNSKKELDERRGGFGFLINRLQRAQDEEIAYRMHSYEGEEHTPEERKNRRSLLNEQARGDRMKVLQQLEEAYSKQVKELAEWAERQKKAKAEAAKNAEEDLAAEKQAAEKSKEAGKDPGGTREIRRQRLAAELQQYEAEVAAAEKAITDTGSGLTEEQAINELEKKLRQAAVRRVELALARNVTEAKSEEELAALNELARLTYQQNLKDIQSQIDAYRSPEQEGKPTVYYDPNQDTKDQLNKRREKLGGLMGVVPGALGSLAEGGSGRSFLADLERGLRDTARGEIERSSAKLLDALAVGTNAQRLAAVEQLKAAGAQMAAASALTALAGAQGGKKQGKAWLGALLGFGLSTLTKDPLGENNKRQSDAGSLAELGINLASGNFLGAAFGLLGGKLKLPKFAKGGTALGSFIAGEEGMELGLSSRGLSLFGAGGPEISRVTTPTYIVDAGKTRAMIEHLTSVSQERGAGSQLGRGGHRVNVYNNQTIYDRADAEYTERREREMLEDVLLK